MPADVEGDRRHRHFVLSVVFQPGGAIVMHTNGSNRFWCHFDCKLRAEKIPWKHTLKLEFCVAVRVGLCGNNFVLTVEFFVPYCILCRLYCIFYFLYSLFYLITSVFYLLATISIFYLYLSNLIFYL